MQVGGNVGGSAGTGARRPLDADALAEALSARWSRITVVDETASTNADLLAQPEAADRTVLAADYQAAGRGRLDRTWVSPRGAGLTFSVLLRPAVPLMHWGWLPLLAGVAVHESVTAHAGVAAALKWPNDLLVGSLGASGGERAGYGKAGGILAQTAGDVVVVGIGINVSTARDELPVPSATSLALAGGTGLDRTGLLVAVLHAFDARYAQWSDVGGDADACGLAAAYRAACATLGQDVAVTGTDGRVLRGRGVDVDRAGRLIVAVDGHEEIVGAGDVEHVRPV